MGKPIPEAFVTAMEQLLGDEAAALVAALDTPSQRALRANTLKAPLRDLAAHLDIGIEPVPWCPDATYLADAAARRLAASPAHAAGGFYLQEPSAMAMAEAVGVQEGDLVLDVAASPGGKATHLAARAGTSGVVVANEAVWRRVPPLLENLERWGHPATVVVSASVEALADAAGPVFDRVVLDAPCSGEAMFRKDVVARSQWSPAHVAGSARRQAHLLQAAAAAVRPGGTLGYSTCTFNRDENEVVVDAFVAAAPQWQVIHLARYWPHQCRCDGHFIAVLRAPDDRQARPPPSRRRHARRAPAAARDLGAELVLGDLEWDRVQTRSDALYLVPPTGRVAVDRWPGVVAPGLFLGRIRSGRFEPSHALALSTLTLSSPVEDVDADEAASFLAGHPLQRDGPPGWVRIRFGPWPLGWGRRTAAEVKPRLPRRARRPG